MFFFLCGFETVVFFVDGVNGYGFLNEVVVLQDLVRL